MTVWTYDEEGRMTSEMYYDESGKPVVIAQGYAGYTITYSEDGTEAMVAYVNTTGGPIKVTSRMPYAKIRRTYDETGKLLLKEEYLAADEAKTRNQAYVYGRAMEYDEKGRIVREYTFDSNGEIASGNRRYASTVYTYDAFGTRTVTRYSRSGNIVR